MEMSKERRMEKTRKLLLWILRLLLSDENITFIERNAMLYTFWMADPSRSMLVGLTVMLFTESSFPKHSC